MQRPINMEFNLDEAIAALRKTGNFDRNSDDDLRSFIDKMKFAPDAPTEE